MEIGTVLAGAGERGSIPADTSSASAAVVRQRMASCMDPRISFAVLLLMNVQLCLSAPLAVEFATVALSVACMLYYRRFASAARWLVAYFLFLGVGFGLASINSTAAAPFASMFIMYRRVIPIFMFAVTMVATTTTGALACALQSLHLPAKMIVALCVALRFFPTMAREFRAVRDAMRTRGRKLTPFSVVAHPALTIERFMVPVMARLGTIADELGNAVVVRGVEGAQRRTSYYELRVGAVDVVIALAALGLLAAAVWLKLGLIAW